MTTREGFQERRNRLEAHLELDETEPAAVDQQSPANSSSSATAANPDSARATAGSTNAPDSTSLGSEMTERSGASQAVFPEDAPILLVSEMPPGVKLPHQIWEAIFLILRDRGREWTDVRVFQADYVCRVNKPLSNKFLKDAVGVNSLKRLFVCIPWVEVMESRDGAMYVRLSLEKKKRKEVLLSDRKPFHGRIPGGSTERHFYHEQLEENWRWFAVPPQSKCVLPSPDIQIPPDLRTQVYELLMNWFPEGVDISTFAEAFNNRYGATIATEKECGLPLEMVLHLMADIVDTGRAPRDHRLWLRPVPYESVKQLCSKEEILELEKDETTEPLGGWGKNEESNLTADADVVARTVRAEVNDLLSPYEEGINIENLSVLYGMRFPERGIRRSDQEHLKKWLEAMPDIAEVFEKEENGLVCSFVKPVSH